MPTIDDLKPKNFTINIDGVEVTCKPLRLSHSLVVAKVGEVFKDSKSASKEEIKQAEVDMDEVIGELIPELKGIELDMAKTMEVITQLLENIQPSDSKYLTEKEVKIDADPKAGTNG